MANKKVHKASDITRNAKAARKETKRARESVQRMVAVRDMSIPKILGNEPRVYMTLWLEPLNRLHAAVQVWAFRHDNGWTGWLEERRKPGVQPLPTNWRRDQWKEVPQPGVKPRVIKPIVKAVAQRAAKVAAR